MLTFIHATAQERTPPPDLTFHDQRSQGCPSVQPKLAPGGRARSTRSSRSASRAEKHFDRLPSVHRLITDGCLVQW